MKTLFALVLLMFVATLAHAQAADTRIACDPIPATAMQPDAFKCTFPPLGGGVALVRSFPAVKNAMDLSVKLDASLTGVIPAGVYVNAFCVSTKAATPDSATSNVIAQFLLGTLSAPTGLIIIVK